MDILQFSVCRGDKIMFVENVQYNDIIDNDVIHLSCGDDSYSYTPKSRLSVSSLSGL